MKLTAKHMAIIEAAALPKAVIWPRVCESVRQYGKSGDGRIHFMAPVDDAFEVFEAKLINSHGVITEAGRLALSKEKT